MNRSHIMWLPLVVLVGGSLFAQSPKPALDRQWLAGTWKLHKLGPLEDEKNWNRTPGTSRTNPGSTTGGSRSGPALNTQELDRIYSLKAFGQTLIARSENLVFQVLPDAITMQDDFREPTRYETTGRSRPMEVLAGLHRTVGMSVPQSFTVSAKASWNGDALVQEVWSRDTSEIVRITRTFIPYDEGRKMLLVIKVLEPKLKDPVKDIERVYLRQPSSGSILAASFMRIGAANRAAIALAVVLWPITSQSGRDEMRALISTVSMADELKRHTGASGMLFAYWVEMLAYSGFVDEASATARAVDAGWRDYGAMHMVSNGLVIAGRIDQGLQLARSLNAGDVTIAAYSAHAGRMNEAHAIVRAMKVSETEIDSVRGHLAAGLSRANRPLDALPFAEAIKQAMLRSSVLAQVAEAFIRLSRPDDAVPLLTMAIDADPRSLYVGQAIAALAASGRTQDAMALLERPGAAGAQNAIWRETATGSVVTGLIESGQIMDAAILAAKITSARPAAVQLAAVAAALARRQRLDDARAFVREVHARIDTARRTDKPNQIEQALTQIATRFATGGLDDEASAILTTLSSTAGDQALDRILDALMNEGRAEAALTLFERQSARWNETRRAGTRREIVSALAKAAGLAGGAEAILADARFETHADLDAVAVGLAASGALEAARNAVGRLPDGSRRDATTCAMSRAFASARAYSDARRAVARCPPEGRWMATMFVLDEFAMNEHPEIKEQKAILRAYRDGG